MCVALHSAALLPWNLHTLPQVDIDADLTPAYHPFRIDVWSRHIAAFMASDFLFVGVPDHSSPINGGVWLAKPRRWLYQEVPTPNAHLNPITPILTPTLTLTLALAPTSWP